MNKLELAERRLRDKEEKILLQKKLLADRKRKQHFKVLESIGQIACRAKIDDLDEDALLGAFIEIYNRKNNPETILKWQEESKKLYEKNDLLNSYAIKFEEGIPKEADALLKQAKFRYNRFRKEYYGTGRRQEIERLLRGYKFIIEEIV